MTWRVVTFVVWGLLAGLLVGCQVLAVRTGRIPTAGMLVRVAVGGRVGRTVVALGWMWLGWHAFAR
jgi:hypothetical protein